MNKLKPGDVVTLASGGPKMTVAGNGPTATGNLFVLCQWFDGTKLIEGTIPEESLVKVDPSSQKKGDA